MSHDQDYNYAFQLRARTAGKIGLSVMAVLMLGWSIATPIIGYTKTGKTDGFVEDSMTTLCGWMQQNNLAAFTMLSAMAITNIGVIAGAGYFAFNKAKTVYTSWRATTEQERQSLQNPNNSDVWTLHNQP